MALVRKQQRTFVEILNPVVVGDVEFDLGEGDGAAPSASLMLNGWPKRQDVVCDAACGHA